MAIKKTELYSSLWQSCDELRGGMDASQYKDYVLTFLFLKYVSDKYLNDPKAMIVAPDGCTFPYRREERKRDTECAKRSWRQIDGESPLLGKG